MQYIDIDWKPTPNTDLYKATLILMKHHVINGPQCGVLAVLVYKWQARDDIYGENDDRKMERCRKNSESVVLAADSVTE